MSKPAVNQLTPTSERLMLDIRSLGKSYGSRAALQGVSLTLPTRCFAVLLGPNGAGKSTLFQVLTGLFSADAGEALAQAGLSEGSGGGENGHGGQGESGLGEELHIAVPFQTETGRTHEIESPGPGQRDPRERETRLHAWACSWP